MCDPRLGRVLIKEAKNIPRLENSSEKFTVNLQYTSKNIRVNLLPLKTKEDRKPVVSSDPGMVKLRNSVIDAHIIK